MNYWLVLGVVGVLGMAGAFMYAAFGWRRAPKVRRAMTWLVAASATAAFLLALPLAHWLGVLFPTSPGADAGSSWARLRAAVEGTCPSDGVPAAEVGKALVLADERHAGDPNWTSTAEQAELCDEPPLDADSIMCKETFIARHALGLDMAKGDRRGRIPCEEIAEFCDGGALAKDSSLCKQAYRTRNARLGGGA